MAPCGAMTSTGRPSARIAAKPLASAIEPLLHARAHARVVGRRSAASSSSSARHGHLLGLGRPGADVAEDVGHALARRRRHHRPAHAQPGGGEALRRGVEHDRVGRDVGADLGRRRVARRRPNGQLPVDLVVAEPQRLAGVAARLGAAAVLLDHQLADLRSTSGSITVPVGLSGELMSSRRASPRCGRSSSGVGKKLASARTGSSTARAPHR